MWNTIKDWSGWSTAGSIVKARAEQLVGLIMAGTASLMAFDFMPFLQETINWTHLAMVSGYLFVSGLVGEVTRRWNTKTVEGHLVPVEVVVDIKKTEALKEELASS